MRLAVVGAVLMSMLGGCVVSEARYRGMDAAVYQRDRSARDLAIDSVLGREGLTRAERDVWVLYWPLVFQQGLRPESGEPVALQLNRGTIEPFIADGAAAHDFRWGFATSLTGKVGGEDITLVKLADVTWLARDERGRLVTYDVIREVFEQETVTVKMSCDHMPQPPIPETTQKVIPKPRDVLRHFTVTYRGHELILRCTENTY